MGWGVAPPPYPPYVSSPLCSPPPRHSKGRGQPRDRNFLENSAFFRRGTPFLKQSQITKKNRPENSAFFQKGFNNIILCSIYYYNINGYEN